MSIYSHAVKNPLISVLTNHLDIYPSPINLTYMWGFGSIAGIALGVQVVTGILLAMHYAPEIHLAFTSVEHIMRDVSGGVILRYIHANGASMFFIVVYAHMFRGLYFGSYFQPRSNLWYSGVLIFFLMMATAFMGYVLPWGQMSFWGATVITNLFSAIPQIGNSIVQLLWGGFSVDNPTLNRFFSLHYCVPFIIIGSVGLHLVLLHQNGSNNPLGISSIQDRIPFYPYFYVKDLFGLFIFIWVFSFFVIYAPNYMGHPDNYIEANPLVTPAHIVPEWYFLPFYAVLRTIPDKLGGVALMGIAIVILALLPVVDTSVFRSNFFKPINLWFFWFFAADSVSLGWIGQEIVETPFIEMANFVTSFYFIYFIVILPVAGYVENKVINSILKFRKTEDLSSFIKKISFQNNNINNTIKGSSVALLVPFADMEPTNFIDSSLDFFVFFFSNVTFFYVFSFVLLFFFLGFIVSNKSQYVISLNRISALYLLYIFLILNLDIVNRGFDISIFNMPTGLNVEYFNFFGYFLKVVKTQSLFFKVFIFYVFLMLFVFLYGILDRFFIAQSDEIEFLIIVFFIFVSSFFLVSVNTMIDIILSLEVITLASYVLVAFDRKNRFSAYAAVQYFIIGSIPSVMLILGASFFYKNWGTLVLEDFDLINSKNLEFAINNKNYYNNENILATETNGISQIFFENFDILKASDWEYLWFEILSLPVLSIFMGVLFIFFNFFFKITAAPIHIWAPSVYSKAPIASVVFLSIFSKGIIFFLMVKVLMLGFYGFSIFIKPFLLFIGTFTIFCGLLGAFVEKVIKKFFVYSSMGHVGFMLIGLSFFSIEGASATFHYLFVYILSSFLMWFVVMYIGKNKINLVAFKELKNSNVILGLIFAFLVFSMSGIPPLGGFFVKLDILFVLLENFKYYINYIVFIFSIVSFFYYLRLIKIIFFDIENNYSKKVSKNYESLLMITILFLILLCYMLIIKKPILLLQKEGLLSIF